MKTLFLGTPALAVPFLEKLHELSSVAAVLTNPDQAAGRGYGIRPTPVKEAALRLGLPVLQPPTLRDPAIQSQVQAYGCDVGIVVAYGKLLPAAMLQTARHGFLNVHFSLLPAYRGAAPMQWALINGEAESGVTLFWLDEGMDTGPIFIQKKIAIGQDDAESLRQKLVVLGVAAMQDALERISRGEILREPQTGPASRAPMLTKDDGRLNWQQSAVALANRIRGTSPWPGAFAMARSGEQTMRLRILRAKPVSGGKAGAPGTIVDIESGRGFDVKCGEGVLQVIEVQPEAKKPMSAWSFWQGARYAIGEKLL